MMNNNLENAPSNWHGVSFRAIIAGAIVAVGITFLFNLLSIGLGLSLFTHNESGQVALTFASVSWFLVGSYVTMFFPGWVTGRLVCNRAECCCSSGMLHGFLTWSVYLILSIVLLGLLTDVISAAMIKTVLIQTNAKDVAAVAVQEHAVNKMGYAGLVTFAAIALGALGTMIGAVCGMKQCKRCCTK